MVYMAEMSRHNPACVIFLVDQSNSMAEHWIGEKGMTQAERLVNLINCELRNLVVQCMRGEDDVRDYYYIGVIGYGIDVGPAFRGVLAGQELVPISEVANNPIRVERRQKGDSAGRLVEYLAPIWFDPIAVGPTPFCQALASATAILSRWIEQHPWSPPPMVVNITGGDNTEGDPTPEAEVLKALCSGAGSVLLVHRYLSSEFTQSILFPSNEAKLPDQNARLLFRLASPLSELMKWVFQERGYALTDGARCLVCNADTVSWFT